MAVLLEGRVKTVLRRAAERATLAPSVHNTQPWRLHITPDELRLYVDRSRQLHVLDPTGRQMIISCGCALLNARVSIAAQGFGTHVERFPDASDPDLLARITIDESLGADAATFTTLDHVVEQRKTNRRRFAADEVPAEVVEALERAAAIEDSSLFVIHHEEHRVALARLSQRADAVETLNPAYRAEIRQWTTDDPRRLDGVQALAVPHVEADSEDELPIRDFDTRGMGWLPTQTHSSRNQCLVLVCTEGDDPTSWLRAGEALERVLLEVTRYGFVASPLTQVTELPSARAALRSELGISSNPHVLLRIGRAPTTPETLRRLLVDVVTEEP